ncbi:MAG: hypothetical protein ACI802_003061, partial [Candidatus Paceibacteria bacterium]
RDFVKVYKRGANSLNVNGNWRVVRVCGGLVYNEMGLGARGDKYNFIKVSIMWVKYSGVPYPAEA